MLDHAGYRGLVVGGAVRNALLDLSTADIDIATDAPPGRVIELAKDQGLKYVPTGFDHGTVTIIAGGTPFEVTTFRRDVETDGRKATVAFSDNLVEDAARRDFTMNALYCTAGGEIVDPVGGLPDLQARRLRFVGDPVARIREDYLRILRAFRFQAWYAESVAPGTFEAIRAEKDGLSLVSAERVGAEMRKLLAAPDPSEALRSMTQTGVLDRILSGADASNMTAMIRAEAEYAVAPCWLRRLALMGGTDPVALLRLSRPEASRLKKLRGADGASLQAIAFYEGIEIARDVALIRAAKNQPPPGDWMDSISLAAASPLPISAADLPDTLTGPALGRGLKAARQAWIASDFSAPAPALIDVAVLAGEDTA